MLIHFASRAGRVEKGREASRAERANGLRAILRRRIVKLFSGVEGFGGEREGKERKKGFADRFAVTLTRVMFEFLLFVLIWEGVAESGYGVNQSSWGEGNGVKWERKLLSHGRIEQRLLDSSFPASS
ncbi:unnamed protein product [Musa acuminata subsp. malaccensis]|uniref:(wild Malaysian banana) hypothetical protein n=1 Tax=Musa acuminata subsp. malaccensis TaxID=214687 RepID=A0A804JGM4_MUSAM|nr:unnamed protein product [Musa acuminata subsp. malaccensis]